MIGKVIQVPMERDLVEALGTASKQQGRSRADLIREACRRYLSGLREEQLDRAYREGYLRFPEEPALGEGQATLASLVLPEERW